jgi:SNF2 family DNA or RNA helicase
MKSSCLRRTKDDSVDGKPLVDLPPQRIHTVRLLQSEKEHLMYQAFDKQGKELFEQLEAMGAQVVREKYQFLMVIILRLRQLCNHVSLCKDIDQFFR